MQRIWGWLKLEKRFFYQMSSPTKNMYMRKSGETFHWSLKNLELLLCDFCAIIISMEEVPEIQLRCLQSKIK